MSKTAGYLSIFFYSLTWIGIIVHCKQWHFKLHFSRQNVFIFWGIAIALQAIFLYSPLVNGTGLILDSMHVTSHVMLLCNVILLATMLSRAIELIALAIIPITILFNIVTLSLTENQLTGVLLSGGLAIHVLIALLGYSILAIATCQAILLYIQSYQLHHHCNNTFINKLPSLQDMERLLFHFLLVGFIGLFLSLLTGFFYLDDMFTQNVAHKTILSIIAFAIYGTLLFGHWRFGWRGKKAIQLTIAAFIVLLLGFMGSKYIYDFLIN